MKISIVLLGLIFLLAAASLDASAQPKETNSLHCGSVVKGLRLCTETLDILVRSPQDVFLRLWLENITKEDLVVQRGNFFKYLYEIRIVDQNGRNLPSFYEIAEEKKKSGTLSSEESGKLLRLCCMGSVPSQQIIAAKEKKLLNVDLSDIYEFKPKTVYTIEIKRIESTMGGKKRIVVPLPIVKIRIE